MTQRNPMNERYSDENRKGKTRKSAASAKPAAARAATVREPRPKTKKEKRAEREEREKREMEKRGTYANQVAYENTPEYKKLRRAWAICLGVAVAMVLLAVLSVQQPAISWAYVPAMIIGYALIIVAFYIDFRKIRKGRRAYLEAHDNSKEARAAQKKARAEAREQRKEAEEKFAAAKAEEEAKRANGFLARLRRPRADELASEPKEGDASGK